MKKIWNWIISRLVSAKPDKYMHFIAGLIIAAWFTIVWPIDAPIVPVIFAAFIKEFIDEVRYGGFDWRDLLMTVCGGAVIQIMTFI